MNRNFIYDLSKIHLYFCNICFNIFRSGPQGTFKTSDFDNSDISGIPTRILKTVESSCEEVMEIGNYV